jgi:alkanesulfonate monooxygenase SsuD/methylene tetrahydromethanopterin reductase-like flavin-dependent oxidoreductase (luciferase family)
MTARGVALFAGTDGAVVSSVARDAERLGYRSFWLNHPGQIDGVAGLARAAAATEAIELGVGVVPLHMRSTPSLVAGVREHRLPSERLLLGIGTSGPGAFALAREGVATLRAELGCAVVMGALSEASCRLAGEIADGVLFNWLTPEHARRSARWVEEGSARVGRARPRLFAYVRLALGADARRRVEEEGGRYAGGSYAAHFARMGATPLETAIAADDAAAAAAGLAVWDGAVDEVVLRFLPASGGLEAHLELLAAGAP